MSLEIEGKSDAENDLKEDISGNLHCSFCGKSQSEVKRLIAGPSVFICDECTNLCVDIITDKNLEEEKEKEINRKKEIEKNFFSSPKFIFDYLSDHVIGQDQAKKQLSTVVYTHYFAAGTYSSYNKIKQNILMLGPTGTGKTLLTKTLAESLSIPLAIVSATAYTQAGYVGEDVENIFSILLEKSGGDLEKAQRGIVFIDEIDKLARRTSGGTAIERDVSGIGVQQGLLTIMEGAKILVPKSSTDRSAGRTYVEFDTSNVLFVCSGAFVGIEKIILARIHASALMQYDDMASAEKSEPKRKDQLLSKVISDDIINFGFIPEFAGRFSQFLPFNNLYKEDLIGILKNKNTSILEHYKSYFSSNEIELIFTGNFIEKTAKISLELNTGARGIKQIVSLCMTDLLFEVNSWKNVSICEIDEDFLQKKSPPKLYSKKRIPVMLNRDRVFLSYSHNDTAYCEELIKILKPLKNTKEIDIWSDKEIVPGENWQKRINESMARSKIAIFLISSDFLASDYAMQELDYFLEMKDAEDIKVFWALVSPCLYSEYNIKNFQAIHDLKISLDKISSSERKDLWVRLSQLIKDSF